MNWEANIRYRSAYNAAKSILEEGWRPSPSEVSDLSPVAFAALLLAEASRRGGGEDWDEAVQSGVVDAVKGRMPKW